MRINKKGISALLFSINMIFTVGCGINGQKSTIQTPTEQVTTLNSLFVSDSKSQSNNPSNQSSDLQTIKINGKNIKIFNSPSRNQQVETLSFSRTDSNLSVMSYVTAVRLINQNSGWLGGKGWVARTDNGGRNWHVQYVGTQTVNQIFAINGNVAWVVFNSNGKNRLFHTTDGGKHWTPLGYVPVKNGFLHFISSKEALVSNYYTKDGGKTWTKLPVPSHIVGSAYFHDQKHGWVVLNAKNKVEVQRSVDGGKTWRTVMSRNSTVKASDATIRSMGQNDAWIELVGDSGMSQTSYSLFHTKDSGARWTTVIENSTAGGGPAPGFTNYGQGHHNAGAAPGPLYVVNSQVTFMAGYCGACDQSNTVGWTKDGGKTWFNSPAHFSGFGGSLIGMADANHGWWITRNYNSPSVFYTTSNGGKSWTKVNSFRSKSNNSISVR